MAGVYICASKAALIPDTCWLSVRADLEDGRRKDGSIILASNKATSPRVMHVGDY
jgi:hypothetical protein